MGGISGNSPKKGLWETRMEITQFKMATSGVFDAFGLRMLLDLLSMGPELKLHTFLAHSYSLELVVNRCVCSKTRCDISEKNAASQLIL